MPTQNRTLRFTDEQKAQVLERTDLVALVSRDVPLKLSGRSHVGLCPFHEEKTPSFHVTPRRWQCYGCQRNGDAFQYLRDKHGLTFVDAVRQLARDAGIELHSQTSARPVASPFTRALTFAERHFAAQFEAPEASAVRDYVFKTRGLTAETARRFGLGYAPAPWATLAQGLARERLAFDAETLGLVVRRPKTDGHYDFLRNRVTFPLRAPTGQLLGFAGRFLGTESAPKYLVTPESPLYRKREHLYGLDVTRAAIRSCRVAVLVEGYFDVHCLFQVGVQEVVALSSTAITPSHVAQLVAAGAEEVVLLFDGDKAGLAAIESAARALLPSSLPARVASLPAGTDPDDYALTHGEAGVRRLLADAQPLSVALLHRLLPEGATAGLEVKLKARKQLAAFLALLPEGFTRAAFLTAAAAHFGVPEAALVI
ncbi:DNA primase [Corallococcus terminator]|nr:DNA primase [Corallococcus terminator]